jgi:hypothetical protein
VCSVVVSELVLDELSEVGEHLRDTREMQAVRVMPEGDA